MVIRSWASSAACRSFQKVPRGTDTTVCTSFYPPFPHQTHLRAPRDEDASFHRMEKQGWDKLVPVLSVPVAGQGLKARLPGAHSWHSLNAYYEPRTVRSESSTLRLVRDSQGSGHSAVERWVSGGLGMKCAGRAPGGWGNVKRYPSAAV